MPVSFPHTSRDGPGNVASGEQVMDNLNVLKAAIDAGWTADDLTGALAALVGVSSDGTIRRGKSIVTTEESRSNAAYGLLTTPDRVAGVVLPSDGLIFVAYQATWREAVNGAAAAAIFVGGNQLKVATMGQTAPSVNEAACDQNAGVFGPLASTSGGLAPIVGGVDAAAYTGDVATGQVVGLYNAGTYPTLPGAGPTCIFAAAGTYDVSVQFKASSGAVTAKNRKLWVWTLGF